MEHMVHGFISVHICRRGGASTSYKEVHFMQLSWLVGSARGSKRACRSEDWEDARTPRQAQCTGLQVAVGPCGHCSRSLGLGVAESILLSLSVRLLVSLLSSATVSNDR